MFICHYIWIGGKSLLPNFPILFSLSTQKNNKVSQMGRWVDEEWC